MNDLPSPSSGIRCTRNRLCRSVALTSLILALASFFVPLASQAQSKRDPLNDRETDQVRELRDQPMPRIRLYQGFLQQRIDAIKSIGKSPKTDERKADLRSKLEEFTYLSDELQDNLLTFDDAHADLRKALKDLLAASSKWPAILEAAEPDPMYEVSQETALESAQSTVDQARELLRSQTQYFSTHKDEANKNGTGPS